MGRVNIQSEDTVASPTKGMGQKQKTVLLKVLLPLILQATLLNCAFNNTLRVGRTDDPTTPITITPTISQPVTLECQRDSMYKQWFTDDSVTVTPTNGELTNTPGPIRTLSISSFSPSHAGTYTCKVKYKVKESTVYPVVLVNSLATNTLRVGRTDDPTTPITITPTISQPVKLECQRDSMYKQWFTDDSVTVTPTNGELTNTPGPIRTLSISSFSPSHAGTYTCKVNRFGPTPTVYSVVVTTELPPKVRGIKVRNYIVGDSSYVVVSWTSPTGFGITYNLWYSTYGGQRYAAGPPPTAANITNIQDTTTTLKALRKGYTYYIWIAAIQYGRQGVYSARVQTITCDVPRAPTSLLVTPPKGTCTQLHVRWNSSPQQPDCPANVRYRVIRDGRAIYDLLSSNSIIFNNLIPNKQYKVKIVAHNGLGDGRNVVTTMGTTRSQAPIISSISADSPTQISLTLTAPLRASSLTYQCIGTPSVLSIPERSVQGMDLQMTMDDLCPGINYEVYCVSKYAGLLSCYNTSKSSIVTPWPVISSVSVTYPPLRRCYSSLSVSWDGPTAACLTYTIWYSTNSGTVTQPPPEALTMSEISSTSAVLAGLTHGTVYYIWVAAVSPGGQGHYSSRVTKRVENAYPAPSRVSGMMLSNIDLVKHQHGLWFSWTEPSSGCPIEHYMVQYKISSTRNWISLSSNLTDTVALIDSLNGGTTYRARVRAVSKVGSGQWSVSISQTTKNDTNECLISNGRCQQICLNTLGSYRCMCNDGHTLNEDGHTCASTESVNFVTLSASGFEGQTLILDIERRGRRRTALVVNVTTMSIASRLYASAAVSDYRLLSKVVVFNNTKEAYEKRYISVDLIGDRIREGDEVFYVVLSLPVEIQSNRKAATCVIHNL